MIIKPDRMTIQFYPESGHFAFNVDNKIYFEAFTDDSRAEFAELTGGKVVKRPQGNNQAQETVVLDSIKSEHLGRGSFTFFAEED